MDEHEGRWTDPPILPELATPPDGEILVRGAQVVRVHDVDNPNPKLRGFTEAVVVAWARIPGGGWAALCAWLSGWHETGPHGGRTTGRGRFGWYRIIEGRVEPWRPPHRYLDGDSGWHGHGDPSEVQDAIGRAIEALPEELRERAAIPYEPAVDDPAIPDGLQS